MKLNRNKKNLIYLSLFFIFLFTNNIYGQKITLGAKVGVSAGNNMNIQPNETNLLSTDYSLNSGKNFGIFGEYHFTKSLSFQSGFQYAPQIGLKEGFQEFDTPEEWKGYFSPTEAPANIYLNAKRQLTLNYLSIPLLFKYSFKSNKRSNFNSIPKYNFYGAMGPSVDILLDGKEKITGSGTVYQDKEKVSALPFSSELINKNKNLEKSDIAQLNFGLTGILGISNNINKSNSLFLEVGINYSLSQVTRGTDKMNIFKGGLINVGYAYTIQESVKKNFYKRNGSNSIYR